MQGCRFRRYRRDSSQSLMRAVVPRSVRAVISAAGFVSTRSTTPRLCLMLSGWQRGRASLLPHGRAKAPHHILRCRAFPRPVRGRRPSSDQARQVASSPTLLEALQLVAVPCGSVPTIATDAPCERGPKMRRAAAGHRRGCRGS